MYGGTEKIVAKIYRMVFMYKALLCGRCIINSLDLHNHLGASVLYYSFTLRRTEPTTSE